MVIFLGSPWSAIISSCALELNALKGEFIGSARVFDYSLGRGKIVSQNIDRYRLPLSYRLAERDVAEALCHSVRSDLRTFVSLRGVLH